MSQTRMLRDILANFQKEIYTSITGYVLAFDPGTQLAQLQIGIKARDKQGQDFNPTPIIECPVQFAGGGRWSVDHKLVPNDEGIIVFSQRCLDAWIQTGGVAQNPIARFHDKQDAMFIPGVRSKPNVIKGFQNNGIRLRNDDASVYVWLKDDETIEAKNSACSTTHKPSGEVETKNSGGFHKLQADGTVNINGLTIDPNGLLTDGKGTTFDTHSHSQNPDSAGNGQQNTNPPIVGS